MYLASFKTFHVCGRFFVFILEKNNVKFVTNRKLSCLIYKTRGGAKNITGVDISCRNTITHKIQIASKYMYGYFIVENFNKDKEVYNFSGEKEAFSADSLLE